MEFLYVKPGGT